ncbi:MAG TPA: hypothetical protein VF228_04475 [Iamia sp.]
MTSAVVRNVHSPDVEEVWTARPLVEVPDPFLLELDIGPAGQAGVELDPGGEIPEWVKDAAPYVIGCALFCGPIIAVAYLGPVLRFGYPERNGVIDHLGRPEGLLGEPEAIGNRSTRISVALDDLSGTGSVQSRVMAAVTRSAGGRGDPFDRELMHLYNFRRLSTVHFFEGGRPVANPFG